MIYTHACQLSFIYFLIHINGILVRNKSSVAKVLMTALN